MKRIVLVVLLAACGAMPAAAQQKEVLNYRIVGAFADCPGWTKTRADNAAAKKRGEYFDIASALQRQWLLGYLAGMTSAKYARQNPLRAIDADTVAEWMDRYCVANPKADVTQGAEKLMEELARISAAAQ